QRAHFAAEVRVVAVLNLFSQSVEIDELAFGFQLSDAALGARIEARVDVELDLRVGKHDRADVAAFEHHAFRSALEDAARGSAHFFDERFAHETVVDDRLQLSSQRRGEKL